MYDRATAHVTPGILCFWIAKEKTSWQSSTARFKLSISAMISSGFLERNDKLKLRLFATYAGKRLLERRCRGLGRDMWLTEIRYDVIIDPMDESRWIYWWWQSAHAYIRGVAKKIWHDWAHRTELNWTEELTTTRSYNSVLLYAGTVWLLHFKACIYYDRAWS